MRGVRAGNTVEVRVAEALQDDDWLVGSRRHIAGPGDLLAIRSRIPVRNFHVHERRLIEVKSTAGGPYERFGPADRQIMISVAEAYEAEAWLAWWPPNGELHWLGVNDWPGVVPEERVA